MKFVRVPGTDVLFSVWDTRVKDYADFARLTGRQLIPPPFVQKPDEPVVNVNIYDAEAYCEWLTVKERRAGKLGPLDYYRLPTDAEWSTAVGLDGEEGATPSEKNAQIKGTYPWGTEWPPKKPVGNFADSTLFKVSPMWRPIENYTDGFANTSPVGSFPANRFGLYDMSGNVWQWTEDFMDDGPFRVARGGSLYDADSETLLSSRRAPMEGGTTGAGIGFRCVLARLSEGEFAARRHALAFIAIEDAMKNRPLNQLRLKGDVASARADLVKDGRGILDRKTLLVCLQGLQDGRLGVRSAAWLAASNQGKIDPPKPGTKSGTAWDFAIYMAFCRAGYNAGYLSQGEAWTKLLSAARFLQQHYRSWDDYAVDAVQGIVYSSPVAEESRIRQEFSNLALTLTEPPDGVWAGIPWAEPLSPGPVLVDHFANRVQRIVPAPSFPPDSRSGISRKSL